MKRCGGNSRFRAPQRFTRDAAARGARNLLLSKVWRMTQPSPTYRAWKKMSPFPGGSWAFSAAAMARVPYFASILPHVVRMEPGLAEVTVPKWFYV